jgi:hypothetical protein
VCLFLLQPENVEFLGDQKSRVAHKSYGKLSHAIFFGIFWMVVNESTVGI